MIEVKGQQDYDGAFAAMDDLRGQPLILPAGPMFCVIERRSRKFCLPGAFRRSLLSARTPRLARS